MSNETRLERLRKAVDEETPVDGIHNTEVKELYEQGGCCPRYLGCTSEGSGESSYRDNPDFFSGDAKGMRDWLAGSYEEGWAANWVLDLERGEGVCWQTFVQMPRETRMPFVIATLALTGAANDVLVEYLDRLKKAEKKDRLDHEIGVRAPVDVAAEIVNRALGRGPDELAKTKSLIGLKGGGS